MKLKENIQGKYDNKLEDANSLKSILKASPMENQNERIALKGKTKIIEKTKISNKIIQIKLFAGYSGFNSPTENPDLIYNDIVYGNTISNFEFLRFYYTQSENIPYIDIKITKVPIDFYSIQINNSLFEWYIVIEGILLNNAKFEDIKINEWVRWGFYMQKKLDDRYPKSIKISDITSNSATISWEDSTDNKSLMYQIKWRELNGTENFSEYSLVGGWIFDAKIVKNGSRYPEPTETYLGKKVYWMEFSEPELKSGKKAEGWIEIIDGNFKNVFITNIGSGYQTIPKIKFYFRKLSENKIENPKIIRLNNNNKLIIEKQNHPFQDGDFVILNLKDYKLLNKKYKILNVTINNFEIEPENIEDFPLGTFNCVKGTIELAPIENFKNSGKILPILSKNKFYLKNLIPNRVYEICVVSFFDMNLKDYSDYSKPIRFKTKG